MRLPAPRRQALLPWLLLSLLIFASGDSDSSDETCPAGGCKKSFPWKSPSPWEPKTLSVVLPCANEGEFAQKTAKAVAESVPPGILAEIIVVDDGSKPSIASTFDKEEREKLGVRIVRHKFAKGLIQAKSAGARNATGDVIVFFDCHVGPQTGWHTELMKEISGNYRRIVVPSITNLNIDTWKQDSRGGGVNKCYLTWDADFKWFNSKDNYMPVLSGGLLGISRKWWNETGGYDSKMKSWGGENIDQSLRTWLCGGEIVAVPKAEVAHMWRTPDDPRTMSGYEVDTMASIVNRARAAKGWYGKFAGKLKEFPWYPYVGFDRLDVSEFKEVQQRLGCRPFSWFLWRFKSIYEHAGLVPEKTFKVRHAKSGLCLTYLGPTGTHQQGQDEVRLEPCKEGPREPEDGAMPTMPPNQNPQRWHLANRNSDGLCCSGLRALNTDQCLSSPMKSVPVQTHICEVSGRNDMMLKITDGTEQHLAPGQFASPSGFCLVKKGSYIQQGPCKAKGDSKARVVWEIFDEKEPAEYKMYKQALELKPELYVD
mmetsp:Transcript_850/g.1915  ORF Transcript_850/g.1915 Transcript_850/m.1915 type:complete len:539 (-) Transcript_850:315-1931(-)